MLEMSKKIMFIFHHLVTNYGHLILALNYPNARNVLVKSN